MTPDTHLLTAPVQGMAVASPVDLLKLTSVSVGFLTKINVVYHISMNFV